MSVGTRIRESRKVLNLSQRALAHAIGVTPQHISLIEKDRRVPSLAFLIKMAKELGVTVDYLVTGREGTHVDLITTIKADKTINIEVKRALITLIEAIKKSQDTTE